MDQESGQGLAQCLWLKLPHKTEVRMAAIATASAEGWTEGNLLSGSLAALFTVLSPWEHWTESLIPPLAIGLKLWTVLATWACLQSSPDYDLRLPLENVCVCVRERERERQRQTDRQTDRQNRMCKM